MSFGLIIGMLSLLSPCGTQDSTTSPQGDPERVCAIVRHCKGLGPIELHCYLRKLGEQRDFEALTGIYHSDLELGCWAAGEAARVMDKKRVVAFCKSFPLGSLNWQCSFLALRHHPKAYVIPYIKETVASTDPIVRYHCYKVCIAAGWGDLLSEAAADKDKTDPIAFPNQLEDEQSLGLVALKYIARFQKQKKR